MSNNDSPLYAECKPPAAISYVLLRPGNTSTTVLDVPPSVSTGSSPAYSGGGARAAVRRRSSQSDLRALTDRLEQLGAVDVARSLAATASADAVAWSPVTHRGCCIALPLSGINPAPTPFVPFVVVHLSWTCRTPSSHYVRDRAVAVGSLST